MVQNLEKKRKRTTYEQSETDNSDKLWSKDHNKNICETKVDPDSQPDLVTSCDSEFKSQVAQNIAF